MTFSYIKMLKEVGPQLEAFEEMSEQKKLSWAFIEKSKAFGFVTWFAEKMTQFDDSKIHKIISSNYLYEKFDKDHILKIVQSMDIKSSLVLLYSQTHSEDTVLDKVEKWYQTKYCSKQISEDFITKVRSQSYENMH